MQPARRERIVSRALGRFACALALAMTTLGSSAHGQELAPSDRPAGLVEITVPEPGNLQLAVFWIALGAGYFADQGISVAAVSPPARTMAMNWLRDGTADVGLLPPPMYLALMGEGAAIRLAANLLQRDPINLVVSPALLDRIGVSPDAPLKARLEALRGSTIGVARGPQPRLRALFRSEGLGDLADIAIVGGRKQNAAFARGDVDALYAHTPYLQRAIFEQGGIVYVRQSAGEVQTLADLHIHMLVVSKSFASQQGATVRALATALWRAAELARNDLAAAQQAARAALPNLPAAEVDLAIEIYAPALPRYAEVSAAALQRTLELFPVQGTAPKPEDIRRFIWQSEARPAPAQGDSDGQPLWAIAISTLFLALVAYLSAMWLVGRE